MLTARAHDPEMMDAADLPPATYAQVLGDLARVNTITMARPMTLRWLARATRDMAAFSLTDIGFGHGDMLRAVARWAVQNDKAATLTGFDLNPNSAAVAAAASAGLGINFVTGDARAATPPDFIISSLVAHHMGDAELVEFLRWMDSDARRGWFINDLHRHWLAHRGYQALSRLAGWHPIVRHDGALSVRRGFTRAEWSRLLAAAGVQAEVRWHLPFRWGVGRIK
jgi:SAM-dependent methyltransferase